MPQSFDDFMQELEKETRRAGPAAIARADALKGRYTLASDLIALRKRRGLTLRQLSARAGIQQGKISRIEGGRVNPSAATLAALARALAGELRIVPAGNPQGPSVGASGERSARARLRRRAS
jgi:transcriptional regulator with XRE-family HTH domain